MISTILWSVSFRAICQQGLVQGRARGALAPQNETHSARLETRASNLFQSAAASQAPGSGGGRTVERTPNPALRFGPAFSHRLICKLSPAQVLAGRVFSFFGALVQHLEKSGRSIAHGFQVSPVLLWPVAHEKQLARRKRQSAVKG